MVAVVEPIGLTPLIELIDGFTAALRGFDPALVPGEDARRATEALVGCERAVAAVRMAAALRAGECRAFPTGPGVGDAADWLAKVSGGTRRQAADELRLAHRLEEMPGTRAALEGGEVSPRQAMEIAATEADVPGSEGELLEVAKRSSLQLLKETARKRRHDALDPNELASRQRAARSFRHWTDELGMVRGTFALEPIEGTALVNRLDAETDRRVRAEKVAANRAARAGQLRPRETREQHAADALATLAAAGGVRGRAGRPDVVLVGDVRTVLAGDDAVGAGCRVVGGSPIPVETLRRHLRSGQASIKGAVHDGTNVRAVQHLRRLPAAVAGALDESSDASRDGPWGDGCEGAALDAGVRGFVRQVQQQGVDVLAIDVAGRRLPAELRTAIALGQPGAWDGYRCQCGRRHGVELDHVLPVASGGTTSYRNLEPRCRTDHLHKTAEDRARGLLTPADPGAERGPP